jgi:NADPH-dependent curcumin reductase CurA
MTSQTNRQFLLAKRPVGAATRETFTYQEVPVGEPAAGQILVKNEYLSLDPAMRGWMNEGKSYIPPVGLGEVMRALGVGKVVASNNPGFAVGDYVNGALGVQDYFLGEPRGFYKVDPKLAPLPPTSPCSTSVRPRRARPWCCQGLRVRSAALPDRLPKSKAAG